MTNPVLQNERSTSKVPGTRRLLVIGVVALLAVGLFILAFTFGSQLFGGGQPANETPAGPAPATASDPTALTEFRNDQIGFTLSYPASWVPREPDHPTVLLRVSDEAGKNALGIRALELPQAVGQAELPAAKQELDQIVRRPDPTTGASTTEMLVEPEALQVAGLPGYRYFYSFKDEASGQQIGHVHYFLFKGKTMLTLVFEAVPLGDLAASAPTFDQIIGSFRML